MSGYLLSLAALSGLVALTPTSFAASQQFSSNWAGYIADSANYSGVGATWTVPTASSTRAVASDATWVGIGGETSNDMIQAGTQAIVQNGTTEYQAWYELLPAGQHILPIAIHAGDSVTISVIENAVNDWRVSINDTSTGGNWTGEVTYDSSHSSAEWIEEAPLAIGTERFGPLPLDEFGTVSFTNGFTIANGSPVSIAGAEALPITMARGNIAIATPSTLSGDTFSVSRSTQPAAVPTQEITQVTYRVIRRSPHFRHRFVVWISINR